MNMTQLVLQNLPACLSIGMILLLAPFERWAPRVPPAGAWLQRLCAVSLLGAAAILTSYVANHLLLDDLLAAYSQVRLFSLAKLPLEPLLIFVVCFLVVDLVNYALHFLSHKVRILWRMHAIHHADEHVAASTTLLHHPLEILVHFLLAMLVYVMIGIPIVVVTAYAFLSAAHSVFSHANIAIAPWLDRMLRLVIITPDMHRTHHSIVADEGNSNFGSIFPFWDRLFGTYLAHPSQPEAKLAMGLPPGEGPAAFAAGDLLMHPLPLKPR